MDGQHRRSRRRPLAGKTGARSMSAGTGLAALGLALSSGAAAIAFRAPVDGHRTIVELSPIGVQWFVIPIVLSALAVIAAWLPFSRAVRSVLAATVMAMAIVSGMSIGALLLPAGWALIASAMVRAPAFLPPPALSQPKPILLNYWEPR